MEKTAYTKKVPKTDLPDPRHLVMLSLINYLRSHQKISPDVLLPDLKTSNLGYFSKPLGINYRNTEFILKLYTPVKGTSLVSKIIRNHNEYIRALRKTGIRVPATIMFSRKTGKKQQIAIVQEKFRDDELVRNRIVNASELELIELCNLIFNEIVMYWRYKPCNREIGFHPTLRNFSIRNGNLFYFDTFPPMLFGQKDLNRIILTWSPYGGWIKNLVHPYLLNRVSDEYYCFDKMFTGVVGSCCRLRPDDADKILSFSREYVKNSQVLSAGEKEMIIKLLVRPPKLSFIWLLFRKLSGNTGKPNI